MYYVAQVDRAICSQKNCHLCTTYCPEANCINYSEADRSAYISVDRCKACEICVYICDEIAKNHAIKMQWIDNLEEGFVIKRTGVVLR
ncbi:MAG: pyruvate ferredoxin oxidoreductase [Nitrospinae bacterium CG11_big_fil_rev_8_21_14_0_20_56_8]|nr:MAG: pyruvate ferredoxin oxidoreductase [Nitrospinae bacterium CG11_big_fil_rev_8_21_14_0_20_56_8]